MKIKCLKYILFVFIMGIVLSFSPLTHATPIDIRIDLDDMSTTGSNWNNISNLTGTTGGLVDFGTAASTAVSITGAGGWRSFYGDVDGAFIMQDWLMSPSTYDGAGLDKGVSGTYTFSGLTASSYRIEIVSARTTFDYMNFLTVDGALASRTFDGSPVVNPWGSYSDGLTQGNWLIWDDVSTTGTIDIMNMASSDTLGMINAIRLLELESEPVPEPGTMLLLGTGLAGLFGFRKKFKI